MKSILSLSTLVIIVVLIGLSSCNQEENDFNNYTCEAVDPTEELEWLREAIEEVKDDKYSSYKTANYKGETVFFYTNCDPLVNYASILIGCSRDTIGYTYNLLDEITGVKTIWKHDETMCND